MSDRYDRVVEWARSRPERVAGHNPWTVVLRTWREIMDDRVPGLAAEMAFFALLSFVPLVAATGAALGYLDRVIGREQVARGEDAVIDGLEVVFSPELTEEVIAPLVRGLLAQERGGVAIGGLLVTLWLASRVFTATIRALDLAFDVEERRNLVAQRATAVLFSLGSVLVVALTLGAMVVGPLLGGGQALAGAVGLGDAFATAWEIGRWPVLALVGVGFLLMLYRYGPNTRTAWRHCFPGAVLGFVLWVLVSLAFRVYLDAGTQVPAELDEGTAAAAAVQVLGAVVAAILWVYVSGIVILVGGELNGELAKGRAEASP